MSFVVVNMTTKETTRQYSMVKTYRTHAGARNVATRINKRSKDFWVAMSYDDFQRHDPIVYVTNLMNGGLVSMRKSEVGGPCDPSTEGYWCR